MNKDDQNHKKFLEEQLHWCKARDGILEGIEVKLYEMERIAEYARVQELTSIEVDSLNGQLNDLKSEVQSLEMQLHIAVH